MTSDNTALEASLLTDGAVSIKRADTDGPALTVSKDAWNAFVEGARIGDFDYGNLAQVTEEPGA